MHVFVDEKRYSCLFSCLFFCSVFPLFSALTDICTGCRGNFVVYFWCDNMSTTTRFESLMHLFIQDYLQFNGIQNLPVKVTEVKNNAKKQTVLFCLTALARVSMNLIDDPFSLPRGHSNGRSRDLHRDRWDLACSDLAELIFLTGLVSGLIINVATAINIEGILQRSRLLA